MKNCYRVKLRPRIFPYLDNTDGEKRKKSNFQKILSKFLTVDPIEVTMYHEGRFFFLGTYRHMHMYTCTDPIRTYTKPFVVPTHLHFILLNVPG